jgi:hypothetical protein
MDLHFTQTDNGRVNVFVDGDHVAIFSVEPLSISGDRELNQVKVYRGSTEEISPFEVLRIGTATKALVHDDVIVVAKSDPFSIQIHEHNGDRYRLNRGMQVG